MKQELFTEKNSLTKMKAKQSFNGSKAQKLGIFAFLGCFIVPIIFLALVKSNSRQFSILSIRLTIHTYKALSTTAEEASIPDKPTGGLVLPLKAVQEKNYSVVGEEKEIRNLTLSSTEKTESNIPNEGTEMTNLTSILKEKQEKNRSIAGTEMTKLSPDNIQIPDKNKTITDHEAAEVTHVSNEKQEQNHTVTGRSPVPESELLCDYSGSRSDTCSMLGDIRVVGKASTIILASSSHASPENSTQKIRPYTRKWESSVMQYIKELTLKSSPDPELTPHCSVNHTVATVIFSTGGFLGNFFHDFTDVLVPLFVTSRQFQGEVQFLVTDFNSKWINKYQPILKQLSHYDIINMDTTNEVHCFPKAHVGLKSHKVLGIEPSKTPNGYTMIDFREFLRKCFSLNKESTKKIAKQSRKKPRLLMVLRKGSRSLVNTKEIVAMTRSLGYKVITAGPEVMSDLGRFAQIVNSCDVLMGVHGAGLANMVFLPTNATVIQIIPWGGLKWACRHDFGEPAPDMGLNYVEYEIKEEESSLIQEYPRDHAVFKDPASIQKQGWNVLWSIFLEKQKVKLDVARFRGVLMEIYQSLKK